MLLFRCEQTLENKSQINVVLHNEMYRSSIERVQRTVYSIHVPMGVSPKIREKIMLYKFDLRKAFLINISEKILAAGIIYCHRNE